MIKSQKGALSIALLLHLCLLTTVMRASIYAPEVRDSIPPGLEESESEKWQFERIKHFERPPGVWEISGRVMPWVKSSYGFGQSLTTTADPNDNYPRIFTNSDGTPLTLYTNYGESYSNGYYSRNNRVGVVMAGLEVARRIPAGFRFSAGVTYFQDQIDNEQFLPTLTGPGEYILYENSSAWTTWFLSLGVEYVINRRGRFRTNVGLHLIGSLYEQYGSTKFLVGGNPTERIPLSSFTTRNARFFSFPIPFPQVTFEYQLKQNWSISAGIGGTTGIGATYNFTPKRKWGV